MIYLKRKKLAFMSAINTVKGFLRRVSGVPDLVLNDCVDDASLVNYTIDGNSVQNGIPAHNAPVDFESVGEYDESTGKYKIPVICSNGEGRSDTTSIYLDEPLRKVGDYADFIDFESKKVVRQVFCEKLNSTNLREMESGSTIRFHKPVSKNIPVSYRGGYSNYFTIPSNKYSNELSNNQAMLSPSAKNIYIRCDGFTLDDYKKFLDNNNVLIYYVMAEAEEKPVILPKLPTIKGTTIYSVDTKLQPLNMEVTYYSTSKE